MIDTVKMLADRLRLTALPVIRDEADLQVSLAAACGPRAHREVRLDERSRLDIAYPLSDGRVIAVEVKIKGSVANVTRQLTRYAEHPSVAALIFVTTRAQHQRVPLDLHGKPVLVVHLTGAAL